MKGFRLQLCYHPRGFLPFLTLGQLVPRGASMKSAGVCLCALIVVSLACSSEAQRAGSAPPRSAAPALPAAIKAVVDAAPFQQVAGFAAGADACPQLYAIALTWLNARAALGNLTEPIKALDQLEGVVLAPPAGSPGDAELARLRGEICKFTVQGNRQVVMIHMSEMLLWSGRREAGLSLLRAARDSALTGPATSRESSLPDFAEAFVRAGVKDEALALAKEITKDDKRADLVYKLATELVDADDCAGARQMVATLAAREQADIEARCIAGTGKWADAWKQIQSIPGGDYHGAKSYLEGKLTKTGSGPEALKVAQSLIAGLSSSSRPSAGLLRLLVAEGATEEVVKLVAKFPDYQREDRLQPYAALIAAYRKTGRTEDAARLLQEAKQIVGKSSLPESALGTLAKGLREAGDTEEAARLADEMITSAANNPKASTFTYTVIADTMIRLQQPDKAAATLKLATDKIGATTKCKDRAEIAFQADNSRASARMTSQHHVGHESPERPRGG
jgi:tetratricopeptide (TPR) repeat protein